LGAESNGNLRHDEFGDQRDAFTPEFPAGSNESPNELAEEFRDETLEADVAGESEQGLFDNSNAEEDTVGEAPATAPSGEGDAETKPRRRRRRGGRRHRRAGAGEARTVAGEQSEESDVDADEVEADAPEAVAEAPLIEERAEPEPEAPAPKAKAKRGRKPVASRAAAPKRIPPKKRKASEAATEVEVAIAPSVVPTGSADKHLVGGDEPIADDEPVIPMPLSRPRSYRDLDAIPDDYD
jgi:ribonuclease E